MIPMFNTHYLEALYRRNNQGKPYVWFIYPFSQVEYRVEYGIVNKEIKKDFIITDRNVNKEIQSKINEKRKQGYKYLSELKDNQELPTFDKLYDYLNTYLPYVRTDGENKVLPMLAKTFDIDNKNIFKKRYIGQWKINGLRCFIKAYKTNDLFKPVRLQFQSREGIVWNIIDLEDILLEIMPKSLLDKMLEENYILDGELYIPNTTVNVINHAVKNPTCKEHKLLQYWCYDLAIEDVHQYERLCILNEELGEYTKVIKTKEEHYNNKTPLVLLPDLNIETNTDSYIKQRDKNIDLGFEGLIMRDMYGLYQFGKRNNTMLKYKKSTDGKFEILDIYPEGVKRNDIPLFLCKNDINDSTFECHVGGNELYQSDILKNAKDYIGKFMYVEYGERSGVNKVPFHIKNTYIINN